MTSNNNNNSLNIPQPEYLIRQHKDIDYPVTHTLTDKGKCDPVTHNLENPVLHALP